MFARLTRYLLGVTAGFTFVEKKAAFFLNCASTTVSFLLALRVTPCVHGHDAHMGATLAVTHATPLRAVARVSNEFLQSSCDRRPSGGCSSYFVNAGGLALPPPAGRAVSKSQSAPLATVISKPFEANSPCKML